MRGQRQSVDTHFLHPDLHGNHRFLILVQECWNVVLHLLAILPYAMHLHQQQHNMHLKKYHLYVADDLNLSALYDLK